MFNRFFKKTSKPATKKWELEWSGDCSEAIVFGVKISSYQWEDLNDTVPIIEPEYKQLVQAHKYAVEIDGQRKVFAMLEYSYGFYMFFVVK